MEDPTRLALVENIRRVLKKISRKLPLIKANEELIDLVNHADTIAQQLESS